MDKSKIFSELQNKLNLIFESTNSIKWKMEEICSLLKDNVSYYNWVGFYLVERENDLVLGPYKGEKTEHIKIKFGQGICGQAEERKNIFIIQDVSKETNYLSCSSNVKSEIVLPIMKNENIVAELDIDSHEVSPFTDEDKMFVSKICENLSRYFD